MDLIRKKVELKDTLETLSGVVLGYNAMQKEILALPEDFVGNIMVHGSAGRGKTISNSVPYVLQAIKRGESVIIFDPKNEIYRYTKDIAICNGYQIALVNEQDVKEEKIDYALPCKEKTLCFIQSNMFNENEQTGKYLKCYWQHVKEYISNKEKEAGSCQKVNFVLEEFSMIKDIGRDILLTCKGYGVGTICAIQTVGQLQASYPDDWEKIVNNCNVIISTGAI